MSKSDESLGRMRAGTTYGFVIIVDVQNVFIPLRSSGWLTPLKCVFLLLPFAFASITHVLRTQLDSTPVRADAMESGLTVSCKSAVAPL